MIPLQYPLSDFDYAEDHDMANWTSYPEYSWSQYSRSNPGLAPSPFIGTAKPYRQPTNAGPYLPDMFPYGQGGRPATYAVKNGRRSRRKRSRRNSKSLARTPEAVEGTVVGTPYAAAVGHGKIIRFHLPYGESLRDFIGREVHDRLEEMNYGFPVASPVPVGFQAFASQDKGLAFIDPTYTRVLYLGANWGRELDEVPMEEVEEVGDVFFGQGVYVPQEMVPSFFQEMLPALMEAQGEPPEPDKYGMMEPRVRENRGRERKYQDVLDEYGEDGFAFPEKAPYVGSFPLYPVTRARYALAIVTAPSYDNKPSQRRQVMDAVIEAYAGTKHAAALRRQVDKARRKIRQRTQGRR